MPKNNLSKNKKISFILKQVNDVMSQWIKDQPENWLGFIEDGKKICMYDYSLFFIKS